MSDREQLAARLVEAAAQAHEDADAAWRIHDVDGPIRNLRARFMAATVLRELDRAVMQLVRDGHDPIDLSGLADYIENGAGDGQH